MIVSNVYSLLSGKVVSSSDEEITVDMVNFVTPTIRTWPRQDCLLLIGGEWRRVR